MMLSKNMSSSENRTMVDTYFNFIRDIDLDITNDMTYGYDRCIIRKHRVAQINDPIAEYTMDIDITPLVSPTICFLIPKDFMCEYWLDVHDWICNDFVVSLQVLSKLFLFLSRFSLI